MQKRVIIFNLLIAGTIFFQMYTNDDRFIDNSNNMHFGKTLRNKNELKQPESIKIEEKQETEYEKIIRLIEELLNQKNLRATSAFFQKISPQTQEIIKNIINTPDKNYSWNGTFLHRASTTLEVEQLLLLGADSEMKNDLGQIPLMSLLFDNKGEAAKTLLLKSPPQDYNCSDNQGMSLAFYVVQSGEIEILDILLKKGTKLENNSAGFTPLIVAILAQKPGMVKFLLKLGVSVDTALPKGTILPSFDPSGPCENDISGTTPLMFAAMLDAQSVKLLLSAGADVNAVRADGATALMLAYGNQPEIVQDLLNSGADMNAKSKSGLTPLFAAAATNHNTIIDLLKKGVEINTEISEEIFIMHDEYPSVYFNLQGMTPLLMAINASSGVVPFMVECGADVNHATIEGVTPLIMAALTNSDLIPLLIQNGSQVNCATVQASTYIKMMLAYKISLPCEYYAAGLTPLMISTFLGDADAVITLLKCGADVNATNYKGLTALDMAKAQGLKNIEDILKNC